MTTNSSTAPAPETEVAPEPRLTYLQLSMPEREVGPRDLNYSKTLDSLLPIGAPVLLSPAFSAGFLKFLEEEGYLRSASAFYESLDGYLSSMLSKARTATEALEGEAYEIAGTLEFRLAPSLEDSGTEVLSILAYLERLSGALPEFEETVESFLPPSFSLSLEMPLLKGLPAKSKA